MVPGHFGEYGAALEASRALMESDGKISVLTVIDEIPAYVDSYLPPDQKQRNFDEILEELRSEFDGTELETHVVTGHSAKTILEWGAQHAVDCIVIASHRPGFADYLIGSTASRVVRHATCPVFVLR